MKNHLLDPFYLDLIDLSYTPRELDDPILSGRVCPYCGGVSEHVDSEVIYGKSFGMVYLCRPCDAYVGTHKEYPCISLGSLAKKALRDRRRHAHEMMNVLQRRINELDHRLAGIPDRKRTYLWLAYQMDIPEEYCHIGMFRDFELNQLQEIFNIIVK